MYIYIFNEKCPKMKISVTVVDEYRIKCILKSEYGWFYFHIIENKPFNDLQQSVSSSSQPVQAGRYIGAKHCIASCFTEWHIMSTLK